MKIPLNLPPCDNCHSKNRVWIQLHDSSIKHTCSCGEDASGYLGDINVGDKGLCRSYYELMENNDHILSMVFSATALEWDIARLHNKWTEINALDAGKEMSTEELENILRSHRTIYDKLEKTGKLLYSQGFEKYVEKTEEFKDTIGKGFPSLSLDNLIKDFQKKLFWPRNRILHLANTDYERQDAEKSYNIASLGITILNSMDEHRRTVY